MSEPTKLAPEVVVERRKEIYGFIGELFDPATTGKRLDEINDRLDEILAEAGVPAEVIALLNDPRTSNSVVRGMLQ